MIILNVCERQATALVKGRVTTDSVGLPVEVNLSPEYDGLAVWVCFRAGETAADVALMDGTEVTVPSQCLQVAGEALQVGVWAGDGDGNVRIPTVWASAGTIKQGTERSGIDPAEPAPDWAAQVQQYAQDAHDTAERLAAEVDGWETEIDAAVQGAETAAAAARAAASSASSAATSATNAASAASTAAGQASTAAGAATDAASEATGAAASATAAAADATEAAGLADNATAAANAAASNAETATQEAITATTGANTAAATANAAAGSASTAASSATTAAGTATDAAASATSAASAAGTAATAANTAATAANAAAEAATEAADGITDAWLPRVTVGASDGITGGGPLDTALWTERACPGTDGPARIESIHGRTVVWNQLVPTSRSTGTSNGITMTATNGVYTVTGTGTLDSGSTRAVLATIRVPANHKMYASIRRVSTGATNNDGISVADGFAHKFTPNFPTQDASTIFECTTGTVRFFTKPCLTTLTMDMTLTPQLIDLTLMFGAGNEPSTVAEFEAMYPLPYYPYDAGSLLSVNMTGIETTGFNQWDEEWEVGGISSTTGENAVANDSIRSKNYISVIPGRTYYFKVGNNLSSGIIKPRYYDANKAYIGYADANGNYNGANIAAGRVMPANCHYMRFELTRDYGTTYNNDICINLSGPHNGKYEPYWHFQRAIDAGVLRGAGSVYDELTADARIVRVGEVDLGTLEWIRDTTYGYFRAPLSGAQRPSSSSVVCDMTCAKYVADTANRVSTATADKAIAKSSSNDNVFICDTDYSDAAAFKTAMSGVMLHYALATPTVTPYDPPLNLTYRTASGGTERVLHDEPTAPPTLVVQYGSTADGIRDRALAAIANPDGPVAQSNHAVGTYLTMGGKLYKVTTAIATGERIVPGTNATATTVMAEVLSLIQ